MEYLEIIKTYSVGLGSYCKMGCLNNFVDPGKLINSSELEECDIIEFNRLTYSHFGFYIGNGISVHVTGPDGGMSSSSSSSKNFPKGMKQAEKLVDIAGYDYRYNKVRVNYCVLSATKLFLKTRPNRDAIHKALEGLKRDSNGKVILEDPIAYDYNLIANNCEYFATRCRYVGNGFSVQTDNPTMSTTLGTVERATSAIRNDLAGIITDGDKNMALKAAAAFGYAGHTAIGWSAYGAKTTTDTVVYVAKGTTYVVANVADAIKKEADNVSKVSADVVGTIFGYFR